MKKAITGTSTKNTTYFLGRLIVSETINLFKNNLLVCGNKEYSYCDLEVLFFNFNKNLHDDLL